MKKTLARSLVPLVCLLFARALQSASLQEDFSASPFSTGWQQFGNTNLFHWDSARQNLRVTWDSSQPNSYFFHPLRTVLNRMDDFSCAFDLTLDDIAGGVDAAKPSTFPLTIGFQNTADATGTNFLRGTGVNSPNLVEFAFFPDTGFGPTVWPSIWSKNSLLAYNSANDFTLVELPVGIVLRIVMSYVASNATFVTTITTNGVPIAAIHPVTLNRAFSDFRVDSFAIESYSDAGQDLKFGGSLLAHGVVDNIVIQTPPTPVQNLQGRFFNGRWQASFGSRTHWSYTLQTTSNLRSWTDLVTSVDGTGKELTLEDTNAPALHWRFYRIKAQPPD